MLVQINSARKGLGTMINKWMMGGLVQCCSDFSAHALELLQSSTKPSNWYRFFGKNVAIGYWLAIVFVTKTSPLSSYVLVLIPLMRFYTQTQARLQLWKHYSVIGCYLDQRYEYCYVTLNEALVHQYWNSDSELWCFLYSPPEYTVEQTLEFLVNRMLWRTCDVDVAKLMSPEIYIGYSHSCNIR